MLVLPSGNSIYSLGGGYFGVIPVRTWVGVRADLIMPVVSSNWNLKSKDIFVDIEFVSRRLWKAKDYNELISCPAVCIEFVEDKLGSSLHFLKLEKAIISEHTAGNTGERHTERKKERCIYRYVTV